MKSKKDFLKRRVEKVLPSKDGLLDLAKKRKIRLYQGVDPTSTRLHLGHTVGFRKLMDFANAGHEVILLFGTGTVLVGDPSERESKRNLISEKEIQKNIKDWKKQVSPVIDFEKVTVKYNGDWLNDLSLKEIIKISSNISAVQLFKREMFTKRIEKGDTVWYHETLYPILQGYDSVVMDVDLEVGGTDQEFNMLIGRELQKKINGKDKFVLTVPMIMGTDGKTMSKTSTNCIFLTDSANDMYTKLMSINDNQIIKYMELVTNIDGGRIDEVKKALHLNKLHPIDAKKEIAQAVVTEFHSKDDAKSAQKYFENTFQDKKPEYEEEIDNKGDLLNTISQVVASKSEAKRLLAQGAVDVNENTQKNPTLKINVHDKIKVGSKIFVRVRK